MSEESKFFGLYRGTVTNNIDPLHLGRIIANIPDVADVASSAWAMPSVPLAGNQMGVFVVPQVGSRVSGTSSKPEILIGPSGAAAGGPMRPTCPRSRKAERFRMIPTSFSRPSFKTQSS